MTIREAKKWCKENGIDYHSEYRKTISSTKPKPIEYIPDYRMHREEAMQLAVRLTKQLMINEKRFCNQVNKNMNDYWRYASHYCVAAIPTLDLKYAQSGMPVGNFCEDDYTLVLLYDRMEGDGEPGIWFLNEADVEAINGKGIGSQISSSVWIGHQFNPEDFHWYMDKWYMHRNAKSAFEAEDKLWQDDDFYDYNNEANRDEAGVCEIYQLLH